MEKGLLLVTTMVLNQFMHTIQKLKLQKVTGSIAVRLLRNLVKITELYPPSFILN